MLGTVKNDRIFLKLLLITKFYFFISQIGQVVDSPADYYSDRITNKNRKKTLVDELMADAEFKKYNKRRYAEIIEEKSKHQKRYQGKAGKKRKVTT